MKIISQTDTQLVTQDNGRQIVAPIVCLIVALGVLYLLITTGQLSLIGIAFVVIFAGVGFFSFLRSSTITVTFDKSAGTISFDKKAIIGSQSAQYSIANVRSIELRESSYMQSNTTNQQQGISFGPTATRVFTHQSVLVMTDGAEVPLESVKRNNNGSLSVDGIPVGGVLMPGRGTMFTTSSQVAQFLGVPFKDVSDMM